MTDDDKTPVDVPHPMTQMFEDVAQLKRDVEGLKEVCMRIDTRSADSHAEMPRLHRRVSRLTLFQSWFPISVVTLALILKLLHVVK